MIQSTHTTQEGTPFLRLITLRDNELVLPVDTDKWTQHNARVLAAIGVKLLGVAAGNQFLQPITLPAGWKKVAGNRSVYSHIIDNKGRMRVEIISYQAGSNEQKVFMYLCRRYGRSFDHDHFCNTNQGVTHITDGNQVMYTTQPVAADTHPGNPDMVMKETDAAASTWLNKHYPRWHNPGAYWD
jgi:hypothetical protein